MLVQQHLGKEKHWHFLNVFYCCPHCLLKHLIHQTSPLWRNQLRLPTNFIKKSLVRSRPWTTKGNFNNKKMRRPPDGSFTEPLVQACFVCQKTDELSLCPDCGLVYYCGQVHKEIHRPETTCFPFIVQSNDKLGR